MRDTVARRSTTYLLRNLLRSERRTTDVFLATWRFVFVFFSNGTPFDAPNRSETCLSA